MFSIAGTPRDHPDDNVWSLDLPASDFSSARVHGVGPKMIVRREEDGFGLFLDDVEKDRFPDLGSALTAGMELHEKTTNALRDSAYAVSGLSPDRWSFTGWGFTGTGDAEEHIRPGRSGWTAAIGSVELETGATASEAEALLDATPHVPIVELRRLENLWSGIAARNHPSHFEDLVASGLARTTEGETTLTDAGRERIDSDPRTIPVAVRDAIVEAAVRTVVDAGSQSSFDLEPGNEAADLRIDWSEFLNATGIYSGNSDGLMQALRNGLDVWREVIESDPQEVALMAEGVLDNGTRVCSHSAMLMAPCWSGEAAVSELLADTISQIRDELVEMVRQTAGPTP